MLVGDRDSAINVSRSGYRAVTTSGEYFDARGGPVVVDISSKISKITRLISMSSDVEGLFKSISLLKKYIKKKQRAERRIDATLSACAERINMSQKRLDSANESRQYAESRLSPIKDAIRDTPQKISSLQSAVGVADDEANSFASDIERITSEMDSANAQSVSDEHAQIEKRLEDANGKKSELESRQTHIMQKHSRISSDLSNMTATKNNLESQSANLERELSSLNEERPGLLEKIGEATSQKESASEDMNKLRQEEQELIQSSGSSMKVIKEYDETIEGHQTTERSISKEMGGLQRTSDALEREITSLLEREAELRSIAAAVPDPEQYMEVVAASVPGAGGEPVRGIGCDEPAWGQRRAEPGAFGTGSGIDLAGGVGTAESEPPAQNIDHIVSGA